MRLAIALLVLAAGCPRPTPVVPPIPPAPPRTPSAETAQPVPPPVERPIPPARQGDVPEVPPPIKP